MIECFQSTFFMSQLVCVCFFFLKSVSGIPMAYYFFFTSLHVVVALDEDRNVFYMPRVELKTCRRVRIVLQKKK